MGCIVGAGMMKQVERLKEEKEALFRVVKDAEERINEVDIMIFDLKTEAAHEFK